MTPAEQDRALWHHNEIAIALSLVSSLERAAGYAEELRLQALIAAEHARAPTAEATNWTMIADHYATLDTLTGSPIVRLNRAVAVAEQHGPDAGLDLLAGLDDKLPGNHRLPAVRGELARRAGHLQLARTSYRTALERCTNDIERAHLQARLASIESSHE